MYLSRWITRGIVLAVVAVMIPIIMRPIISPDDLTTTGEAFNLMPAVVTLLVSVVLVLLAWGQFQYAFDLINLNRLLGIVANGRIKFKFKMDREATASATYGNRTYRIEVIEPRYGMLTIYIVSGSKLEVRQLAEKLVVIPANGAVDHPQVAFDEVPFSPLDLRKEMRRLQEALRFSLPDIRRFTP